MCHCHFLPSSRTKSSKADGPFRWYSHQDAIFPSRTLTMTTPWSAEDLPFKRKMVKDHEGPRRKGPKVRTQLFLSMIKLNIRWLKVNRVACETLQRRFGILSTPGLSKLCHQGMVFL